jgi:hypothetical protein
MARTHTPTPLFLLAPTALLVAVLASAGCAGAGAAADGGKGGSEKEDEDEDLAKKVELAKLELDLARLAAEQELATAERDLAKAKLEVEKARIELDGFSSLGRARKLDQARLGLDQSRGRAEDAAAELAELEAMYAAEEFAQKTKELVLQRGKRNLEHARRAVDLSERELKELEEFELAGEQRELEQARIAGEKGLLESEQALEKLRLEKRIAIAKAEQELAELEKKAEKKAKKAEKGTQP